MLDWEFSGYGFPIQWHITLLCDKKCKHCYTTDPTTYDSELKNELDFEGAKKICRRIKEFKDEFKIPVRVALTGGHPLLRADYREILRELRKNDIGVEILGNPLMLENEIDFLGAMKIEGYQLSLDGNKKVHDEIRGNGSFEETVNAIRLIKRHKINTDVMYTVSKQNMSCLREICDLCIAEGVRRFSFDRVVPVGSASKMVNPLIPPPEYKRFLYETYSYYIRKAGESLLALKDQLFKPLLYEMGVFKPRQREEIISGCPVGVSGVAILADGTVLPCRRLPIKIGKMPEQSIKEIFFDSPKLNELREYDAIEGCGSCKLLSYCRGDRCVAYALKGDYFSKDPQCWWCE